MEGPHPPHVHPQTQTHTYARTLIKSNEYKNRVRTIHSPRSNFGQVNRFPDRRHPSFLNHHRGTLFQHINTNRCLTVLEGGRLSCAANLSVPAFRYCTTSVDQVDVHAQIQSAGAAASTGPGAHGRRETQTTKVNDVGRNVHWQVQYQKPRVHNYTVMYSCKNLCRKGCADSVRRRSSSAASCYKRHERNKRRAYLCTLAKTYVGKGVRIRSAVAHHLRHPATSDTNVRSAGPTEKGFSTLSGQASSLWFSRHMVAWAIQLFLFTTALPPCCPRRLVKPTPLSWPGFVPG